MEQMFLIDVHSMELYKLSKKGHKACFIDENADGTDNWTEITESGPDVTSYDLDELFALIKEEYANATS